MEKYTPRLKKEYNEKIVEELKKDLNEKNPMALPKLDKIVVNAGLGQMKDDKAGFEQALEDLAVITGQKPAIRQSRKAISNFKIRKGENVGASVTLRGEIMWEFLDRLINIVLPRLKDFRGISAKAFDGNGNYSLGMREHTVFPEIDTNKVTRAFGIQININIKNADNESGKLLLSKLGMPFQKKR